jgi:hypothetical protein
MKKKKNRIYFNLKTKFKIKKNNKLIKKFCKLFIRNFIRIKQIFSKKKFL